jgi:hypothetical protein
MGDQPTKFILPTLMVLPWLHPEVHHFIKGAKINKIRFTQSELEEVEFYKEMYEIKYGSKFSHLRFLPEENDPATVPRIMQKYSSSSSMAQPGYNAELVETNLQPSKRQPMEKLKMGSEASHQGRKSQEQHKSANRLRFNKTSDKPETEILKVLGNLKKVNPAGILKTKPDENKPSWIEEWQNRRAKERKPSVGSKADGSFSNLGVKLKDIEGIELQNTWKNTGKRKFSSKSESNRHLDQLGETEGLKSSTQVRSRSKRIRGV